MESDIRQSQILEYTRVNGRVYVQALAEEFGVASETIRRDLKVLASRRLVKRVHGGAIPLESAAFESSVDFRSKVDQFEKRRIAAAAADLVQGAETIYLDEGYSPRLVAEHLSETRVTVVTSSLLVAQVLADSASVTVMLMGGRLRGRTLATVDHFGPVMLRQLNIDLAFLGTNGITLDGGLTTPDPAVAAVKHEAVVRSHRTVLLAAHSKFGITSFCQFAEVRDFDTIVTGTELSEADARRYEALGPRVLRA